MCVLSDHQPANHQEFELSVIGEITEGMAVNTGNCAQGIISEFEEARTQRISSESDTVTARILSDPVFKQALLDSAGSPLFDPEEPVYATALTSARKMCVQRKLLCWPTWITLPTRVTRGQARVCLAQRLLHYDTELLVQGCYGNQSVL